MHCSNGILTNERGRPYSNGAVVTKPDSNAIKFKNKEKAPKIELAAKQCEKGFWDIFVKDNGIGFDSQHGDSIFQPYFRLNG